MLDRVERVIRDVWGFDGLRPIQGEAISATLSGRDALVVMPTGGGKSLCYQVPPLVSDKLSLVVSPLIALMKDQTDGLRLVGYPAACLHSQLEADQQRHVREQAESGELRLLLTSPERAVGDPWVRRLIDSGAVGAIAIDEAHCISQWGHDFRPEYRRLHDLRSLAPEVPIQAYTATATARVRADIVEQLGLQSCEQLVGRFDRPNLMYRVVARERSVDQIAEALGRHDISETGAGAAIIYALSRRETEELAEQLRSRGIEAKAYHAGLDSTTREQVQDAFIDERLNVVCATVAFGMGIDRSDVRLVVHAGMPKSIEAYQQETGRAGRDGLSSECLLLYSGSDIPRWKRLLTLSAEETGAGESVIQAQFSMIEEMSRLLQPGRCRHQSLSEHFGQQLEIGDGCGACDVCQGEHARLAGATVIAQKILSCVARIQNQTGRLFGAGHVISVLRGGETERVREFGHDQLSTYGMLADLSKRDLRAIVDQLVDLEVLAIIGTEFPQLGIGKRGLPVLRGEEEVVLYRPIVGRGSKRRGSDSGLHGDDERTFQRLRETRRTLAQDAGVPPYLVCSDATLVEIVRARPRDLAQLIQVKGIGEKKAAAFGSALVAAISENEG